MSSFSQAGTKIAEYEDPEVDRISNTLQQIPPQVVAGIIREAIDDVLRGDRTGRYSIDQLTRQEKSHIGTQIEIALMRDLFQCVEGKKLDTVIDGIEVDIKNTIGRNWMIPPEAFEEVCLLSCVNETSQTFSFGVVRARRELLGQGLGNRDKKQSFSALGKKSIRWIIENATLPVSIFLRLPPASVSRIWGHVHGQPRVNELFRTVLNQPLTRVDLATLAKQKDPTKRARDADKQLRSEGITVVCGRQKKRRAKAEARGITLGSDEWASFTL